MNQLGYCDAAVNTDVTCQDIEALERELLEENEKLQKSESACQLSKEKRFFQYNNIK